MRTLLLLLAVCGCAPAVVPAIHPDLVKYIDSFVDDCSRYGANLTDLRYLQYVNYGNNIAGKPEMVGVCWSLFVPGVKFATAIEVQDMNDDLLQKALMYHELGHCVLNLPHKPDTIMAESMLFRKEYEDNWDKLVEGLCRRYR